MIFANRWNSFMFTKYLKQLFVQASGNLCKPLGESMQSSDILVFLGKRLGIFACLWSNVGNLLIFNRITTVLLLHFFPFSATQKL